MLQLCHRSGRSGSTTATTSTSTAAAAAADGASHHHHLIMSSASASADSPTKSPLKFGSITETWKNRAEWVKFASFLANMSEGEDSEGVPMTLDRYAKFLELYVRLDQAERIEGRSEETLKKLVHAIREHEEDFFGTERCLRCIDAGMRRQIIENQRRVKKGEVKAGTWVYQPAYPRVLDKLNELLGSYNEKQKQ